MELLLCAATEPEIRPTIEYLKHNKHDNISILITGIGLTSTTYNLAKYIGYKRPGYILQAGIAGSLDNTILLNTTVVVRNEVIGDEGVEEKGKFTSLFDLKLRGADLFPWKKERLTNESQDLENCQLPIIDAVSVNEISTNPNRFAFYKTKYGAGIESMEGAALHYSALMENIPFLQIRTISNYAGERDKTKWTIGTAIAQLNIEVQRMITKLTEL
jgi:futalosine hydrolase